MDLECVRLPHRYSAWSMLISVDESCWDSPVNYAEASVSAFGCNFSNACYDKLKGAT